MRKKLWIWLALLPLALLVGGAKELERPPELIGAFLRDGDLWLKEGRSERLVSALPDPIRKAAWSADGAWLAYETREPSYEIWAYRLKSDESVRICKGCADARWSHRGAKLAYRADGEAYTIDLENGSGAALDPVRRARGVGQLGWLPDDRGLLVSSLPLRRNGEWQPLTLSVVRLGAGVESSTRPLFTLPAPSEAFFAVSVSEFRWSPDGRWVAFVAEPTASLSMDANSLCLLSADGTRFLTIGTMLSREDWYRWAPRKNRIGFIDGEGRFEISNKRFEYRDAPAAGEPILTPAGMMDLGFAWLSADAVVVPRAPELSWDEGPAPNATPSLYALDLKSGKAKRLTTPPTGSGDFNPDYIASAGRLTWVRSTGPDRRPSDVWISTKRGANASVFIRDVDAPPVWFDK